MQRGTSIKNYLWVNYCLSLFIEATPAWVDKVEHPICSTFNLFVQCIVFRVLVECTSPFLYKNPLIEHSLKFNFFLWI